MTSCRPSNLQVLRGCWAVLLLLGAVNVSATTWDCSQEIEGISVPIQCTLDSQESVGDVKLSAVVDLHPIIAAFPEKVISAIRSDDCRRRWAVRRAQLSVEQDRLRIDARVWAEKRVCEGPLKTRIVEKTGDVVAFLTPEVGGTKIQFASAVESTGLSEFEEQLMEMVGLDVRKQMEQQLDGLLSWRVDEVSLPFGQALQVELESAVISADPPSLNFEALVRFR